MGTASTEGRTLLFDPPFPQILLRHHSRASPRRPSPLNRTLSTLPRSHYNTMAASLLTSIPALLLLLRPAAAKGYCPMEGNAKAFYGDKVCSSAATYASKSWREYEKQLIKPCGSFGGTNVMGPIASVYQSPSSNCEVRVFSDAGCRNQIQLNPVSGVDDCYAPAGNPLSWDVSCASSVILCNAPPQLN